MKGAWYRLERLSETPRAVAYDAVRSVPRAGWFLLGFLFPFFLWQITK